MLRAYIQTSDLTSFEPMLADYYRSGQSDWSAILTDSQDIMEQEIKNRGLLLRNLCKTLTLTDATLSDEDAIERTRLVITSTAGTYTPTAPTILVQGSNDGTTFTTITTLTIASNTTTYYTLSDTYKYYKLTKSGVLTYTAFLVERSFELPRTYLAISLALKSLQSQISDAWESKAQYYMDLYNQAMDRVQYSYDKDENGEVDSEEMKINQVTFVR